MKAREELLEAGRIAAAVRELAATRIVAGALLRDVCQEADDEILRRGGAPAFPTQSSLNDIAAHYCPSPTDETRYENGDLAKLDVGVHVDGYVVDTALTVNVGDRPENLPLVEAAREALEAGIAAARAGVEIRAISGAIEGAIKGRGLRPMRRLCGHGVGRWKVHCPPAVPNVAEPSRERLLAGMTIAIEPFATTGTGASEERGAPEVFRVDPEVRVPGGVHQGVLGTILAFRGLPFARRQLKGFSPSEVDEALKELKARRVLFAYPPLAEATRRPVAQAEHTILVGEDGALVLTR